MPHLLVANPSADVYGSDLQMVHSVAALAERTWTVSVVTPGDGPLVPLLERAGANVLHAPYPVLRRAYASPAGLLRLAGAASVATLRLARLIRTVGADVVYVNTVTLPWWLAAARLARVPVLCHVHEAESADSTRILKLLTNPLRIASLVVTNGQPAADLALRVVPSLSEKIRVVVNGIAEPPAPLAEAPNAPPTRLVCIGRLSPRKSTATAIAALAELVRRGRDVRLEICGTNFAGYEWYTEDLHAAVRANHLDGKVTFSGYVPRVWDALERNHIALAPSLGESLGNAVIEAQLARRAVVATDVQGHRETVVDGRTGLLVAPEQPAAMADAVARLIDDPALAASLATTGQAEARRRFGLSRYGDEISAVIESLRQ